MQVRFLINFSKASNLVAVIKAVRVITGMGLKEAKDIVDKMRNIGEAAIIPVVGDTPTINSELRYLELNSVIFDRILLNPGTTAKIDPTVVDRKLHEALEAAVSFKDYRRARQILDLLS